MTKTKDDENELLKDGQVLRVRLDMMDSVQKAIHAAGGHPHPSHHKPGYRFATDSAAKSNIADAHAEYDREIGERYKHTNPEPAKTPASPVLDQEWDNFGEDGRAAAYEEYDSRIQDSWKNE